MSPWTGDSSSSGWGLAATRQQMSGERKEGVPLTCSGGAPNRTGWSMAPKRGAAVQGDFRGPLDEQLLNEWS